MYLGLNLSHDSSAALLNKDGTILSAIGEERLARKKNIVSFPYLSIAEFSLKYDLSAVEMVIVGSHSSFRYVEMNSLHWLFEKENFPKFDGMLDKFLWPPGYAPLPQFNSRNDPNGKFRERWLREKLVSELLKFGISAQIIFRNHHDGHVFSAIGSADFNCGLAISLDGEGDGESGLVKQFWEENGKVHVLDKARIPFTQSLGYMYTAVTDRYNFKPSSHEGKITGLAAFGSGGVVLDFMLSKIEIREGVPNFKFPRGRIGRYFVETLHKIGVGSTLVSSFENLADISASKCINYADLAYSVQSVLEISVCEMVRYFVQNTGVENIALAGGVFSNVKLNQKIAELDFVDRVAIFPNMGDGGLSVGGVWDFLQETGRLTSGMKFKNVYLDLELDQNYGFEFSEDLLVEEIAQYDWADKISDLIIQKKIVGLVIGKMEFGPRALMNRSIVADPRDRSINKTLNERLRRTEFMPFAPVCLESDVEKLFDTGHKDVSQTFKYMTMTCKVRPGWVDKIPAVVHIDQTGRPQVIDENSHPFAHKLLTAFKAKTGIPCLINTSFNVHEEPIVRSLTDGIRSLRAGAVDFIATESLLIRMR